MKPGIVTRVKDHFMGSRIVLWESCAAFFGRVQVFRIFFSLIVNHVVFKSVANMSDVVKPQA